MARLEWEKLSSNWWLLVDRENADGWWVKYRSYGTGEYKAWQMVYFDARKNHGVLQEGMPEEQLREKLKLEYLLTRET